MTAVGTNNDDHVKCTRGWVVVVKYLEAFKICTLCRNWMTVIGNLSYRRQARLLYLQLAIHGGVKSESTVKTGRFDQKLAVWNKRRSLSNHDISIVWKNHSDCHFLLLPLTKGGKERSSTTLQNDTRASDILRASFTLRGSDVISSSWL